jgi:ribosomal protein S18 acetylase RimI-like enzyme
MTPAEIVIEPFNGNQIVADAVAAHHLAVRMQQREDGENQFRTNIHESQTDLRAIGAYYVEPGGNFFIARDVEADVVAGFIGLQKSAETEGRIKRMAVLPAYRRQHIGTRLAETAVKWAANAGFTRLILATGENENAIHIYRAIGFEVIGYDEAHNDHLMAMDLPD